MTTSRSIGHEALTTALIVDKHSHVLLPGTLVRILDVEDNGIVTIESLDHEVLVPATREEIELVTHYAPCIICQRPMPNGKGYQNGPWCTGGCKGASGI